MTTPPTTIRTSLEVARTRAGVLFAATGTDPDSQPGKAAHGVLSALLYAAALNGAGPGQAMAWAALGELEAPARVLAEHRDRQDARAGLLDVDLVLPELLQRLDTNPNAAPTASTVAATGGQ